MELSKRRRAVTEQETRYFCHQVALAVEFLHKQKVIHRDLKLGNLFLNDEMEIKIGDFGLATKLDYDGERKRFVAANMLTRTIMKFRILVVKKTLTVVEHLYSD